MAELADAADLKSVGWKTVRVQVPLSPTTLIYSPYILVVLLRFNARRTTLACYRFSTILKERKHKYLSLCHVRQGIQPEVVNLATNFVSFLGKRWLYFYSFEILRVNT